HAGRPWALASLALCMLLSSLGTSIANVGLPALAQAFDASFQDVQWIVLFTLASGLSGIASALWLLIAARAAQGLGAAVMMALTMAYVGETVPKAKTGSAMGLLGTMSAIGTALGPSLGGVLIAGLGWRAIFLVKVPLGIAALLLAHRHLPADRPAPRTDRARHDHLGTLLLALTLAAYALAMTMGRGRFGPLNIALLSGAVLGAALFVVTETRAASPLIRLAMLRDRVLGTGLATSALVSTVMMATLVVGPFHLSRALGLDAALVGLVLSVGPLVAALTAAPAGRIVDRLGAPRLTIAGLAAIAAGSAALSLLPLSFGVAGYVAPIVVITAGYALFQTANNTTVMSGVRPDQRGVVSGMLNLSRNLGLITGASVMGAVFAFASSSPDITTAPPAAVSTGMRITFAVAALLIVAALVIAGGRRSD
ncbi:MAG TPA: MFS transporter, partial [Longimicrobium sp.]